MRFPWRSLPHYRRKRWKFSGSNVRKRNRASDSPRQARHSDCNSAHSPTMPRTTRCDAHGFGLAVGAAMVDMAPAAHRSATSCRRSAVPRWRSLAGSPASRHYALSPSKCRSRGRHRRPQCARRGHAAPACAAAHLRCSNARRPSTRRRVTHGGFACTIIPACSAVRRSARSDRNEAVVQCAKKRPDALGSRFPVFPVLPRKTPARMVWGLDLHFSVFVIVIVTIQGWKRLERRPPRIMAAALLAGSPGCLPE